MSEKRIFRLVHAQARGGAKKFIDEVPDGWIADIKPAPRSLDQNARMWAMLKDVSNQVVWYGRKLTPKNWKDMFTAALAKQDVVPGIDGGFVVLGQSTSEMTKKEMSDLIDLMTAFGVKHDVVFHDQFEGVEA